MLEADKGGNGEAAVRPSATIPPPDLSGTGDALGVAISALQSIADNTQRGIAALQRAAGLRETATTATRTTESMNARVVLPRRERVLTPFRNVQPNTTLRPGDELPSDSGNAKLAFQTDGNLVLYVKRSGVLPSNAADASWVARWASNTNGKPAATCTMQGDGNLVIYAGNGKPIWASNTSGHPGAYLAIQDDENVVIYQGSAAIWSTNTWIGSVRRSRFNAQTNGFHFINDFPDGYWQFGALKFNTQGLCGGMAFSALDYFYDGRPIPSTNATPSAVNDPLGQYINARQQQSVEANIGGWTVQILNPDDHALNYWSTHDEWNKLKAKIDAGEPASIGLGVLYNGSASHQVVALGYQEGARERWILTYDSDSVGPSGANESWVYLAPGRLHWSDENGNDWRGFFVTTYDVQAPPQI